MKITPITRFLMLFALILGVCYSVGQVAYCPPVAAGPQATVVIDQPDGVNDVLAEGDDFATTVLGDPWDMSEHTDLMAYHDLPNPDFSGGNLRYVMDDSRAVVRLLFPGLNGRVDLGKVGMNYPIDTSRYHWLSFSMYHSGGSGTFRIKWFYDRYAQPNREYVVSKPISAVTGWHTYIVDLDQIEIHETTGGAIDWRGLVRELDIIPIGSAGDEIRFDWMRLTDDNPTSNSLDISWSGLSPVGSDIHFYLDEDTSGCEGPLIHVEEGASASGSFTWQQAVAADGSFSPTNVEPGDYYVCAKVGGESAGHSSGQLTVNQAPVVHLTQPSFTSGDDFATDAGNPWDMEDSADVDHVVDGTASFSGGNLRVNVPSNDPDVQVHMGLPTSAIDSSEYHYLTYRLLFDYDYTLSEAVGQETRVFWGRAPLTEATSGLLYDYPGWRTYSIDLHELPLHSGLTWDEADWSTFRLDPLGNNKTGGTVSFYLDYVLLTGDEQADGSFDVMWELSDPDTSVTTMTLGYDGDQYGFNGSQFATLTLDDGERVAGTAFADPGETPLRATEDLTYTVQLPLVLNNWRMPCSGACYTWYTSEISSGSYYIYACMDDGYNQLCRYSETPVYISH